MACRVLLINQQDFLEYADLSPNENSKYIIPYIGLMQEKYIRKILCNNLYNDLLSQVEIDAISAEYQALIDTIKPALIYRSYSRYLLHANQKSTASGFRVHKEDNSDPITDIRLGELIAAANSDAVYYENQLIYFLEVSNKDNYPLRDDCGCSSMKDSTTSFKISGIGKQGNRKENIIRIDYDSYFSGKGE